MLRLCLGLFLILGSCQGRKLGGDSHQHDHHDQEHHHDEHHEHSHHQDQDVEIEALESSIQSVFAAPTTAIESNIVGEWSQWSRVSNQNFQSVPSNRQFRPIFNQISNSLSDEYDVGEADFSKFKSLPDYESSEEESDESVESSEEDDSDESNESSEESKESSEDSDESSEESDESSEEDDNVALFDFSEATKTVLDDGTEKYCIEKVAYREELK